MLLKNIEVSGVQVSDYRKRTPELMATCFAKVFHVRGWTIEVPSTITYPLEQFSKAMQDVENRRVRGDVLVPNSSVSSKG